MELDILHRATHPSIVEFYGAFFIESCVYYCMEYMDAGSLDKLYGAGVPEDVLARIVSSMVKGLKFLKDDLQIIHRGVSGCFVLLHLTRRRCSGWRTACRCEADECVGEPERTD